MLFEIERKFLVAHDGWRAAAVGGRLLRDGLVGPYHTSKVRVRLDGERAWLTVKGPRKGLGRLEFEYEIPSDDADEMLRSVCQGEQVEKIRHNVFHDGLKWEVDVYQGSLSGIVLAEVELQREDQPFSKPDWVGQEVSGDPRFKKAAMLKLRRQVGRPLTISGILSASP
ncbi:CYTH domain-containing protein [Enterovirga rhinocerotis]|uniref:CYTH domain-containing protein n=1 Tax=Enterovirga rhinocerotis TaxID=1339210 RepID=A0A4V6PZJ3_9HYPH|nr:CYTH domain-containing protein [Enterovirga rhinocerotis]TDR90159.1 CYTH domain-containing protein [Enterovirga rhinocerotis]